MRNSPEPYQATILVVDDDRFFRELLHQALAEYGFHPLTANGGAEALALCARGLPDLVLLDLLMPEMDGFAVCAALRRLPGAEHLPILMMTGLNETEAIRSAFEAGVTDFITKPVQLELLEHRIRFILHAHGTLQRLARSEARLAESQRIARLGHWSWEPGPGNVELSAEIRLMAGLDGAFGGTLADFLALFVAEDRDAVAALISRCHVGRTPATAEVRMTGRDGALLAVDFRCEPSPVHAGDEPGVFGTLHDVTERRRAENRLTLLKEAMDSLPIGITITDVKGVIVYANPAEAAIHGYTPEELLSRNSGILGPDQLRRKFDPELLREFGTWRRESANRRKDGTEFPVQLTSIAVRNGRGEYLGLVTACEDISERKEAERRIQQLAFTDTLTGLPNRWMFQDRLRQALAHAEREGKPAAVLFLDLDRFKFINDTMGHDFGDQLLRAVGERLDECMRKADTVARLGGDEFVVLLTGLEGEVGAATAARRILEAFARPFDFPGRQIFTAPSIGIALYPGDGTTSDDLVKNADAAMYHAKSLGGQSYRFFSREMNTQIIERMALEVQLRRALDNGEFILYYQPQVDTANGHVLGVEALVRWQHPELGLVMPAHFIGIMEETGLIGRLGEWVLRTACAQAREWRDAWNFELRMAINISAAQFRHPGFVDMVTTVLSECRLDPSAIELELTESVLMDEPEKSRLVLERLKEMGVQLSIDDFGTGYSSLNYLKNFPIDRLKIDRSFVHDVLHNQNDVAIIDAIIAMAHSLNLLIVAEGVETEAQYAFLRHRGCQITQGYYFSRPLPAETLTRLLNEGESPYNLGPVAVSSP